MSYYLRSFRAKFTLLLFIVPVHLCKGYQRTITRLIKRNKVYIQVNVLIVCHTKSVLKLGCSPL